MKERKNERMKEPKGEFISREAAIEIICGPCAFKAACDSGVEPHCSYYIRMAQVPAADVRPVPEWISVEERLPESGAHVLVYCQPRWGVGYVCDAFHTEPKTIPCSYHDDIDMDYDEEADEYYFPKGWWEVVKNWDDYSCVAIEDSVTHWMPLPEPPEVTQ